MRGSPLFEGIHQVDIEIGGEPSKTPTFYYDGAYMQAVFPARLAALRQLMPDPRYVPARIGPGLGAVAISCLEYRDTDIGPYNEIAVAIVLNEPWFRANLPGRALVEAMRTGHFHGYILHLPVTTEIALRGGIDFYNFPKFIGGIEFAEQGDWRICRLSEGQEHIFTFSAKRLPTLPGGQEETFCHLWMDGQPQTAQFSVNRVALGATSSRRAVSLDMGSRHPIALELKKLIVARTPIRYEYVPQMEAILFGPEHLTLPLAKRSLDAVEAVERHPVFS